MKKIRNFIFILILLFIFQLDANAVVDYKIVGGTGIYYENLEACIANQSTCTVINALTITDKIIIDVNKTLTIDFRNTPLAINSSYENNFKETGVLIIKSGTVLLKNSSNVSGIAIGIENSGDLTLENVELSGNIGIKNSGTLTINEANITGVVTGIENTGTLTINGGKITGNIGINNYGNGTSNIYGGEITGNSIGIKTNSRSMTIYGGIISGTGDITKLKSDFANLYKVNFLNNLSDLERVSEINNINNYSVSKIITCISILLILICILGCFIYKNKKRKQMI